MCSAASKSRDKRSFPHGIRYRLLDLQLPPYCPCRVGFKCLGIHYQFSELVVQVLLSSQHDLLSVMRAPDTQIAARTKALQAVEDTLLATSMSQSSRAALLPRAPAMVIAALLRLVWLWHPV